MNTFLMFFHLYEFKMNELKFEIPINIIYWN